MSENVEVHIEISKGSNVKYEYDHEKKMMVCDRVLFTTFAYPFNYGYIPHTLADDGDPLDAVVITEYKLISNCLIQCKIIGCLLTEDEKGIDEKLIVVPICNVDPMSCNINELKDLDKSILHKIEHFFTHYKDLEPNKWTKVSGYKDTKESIEIYNSKKN